MPEAKLAFIEEFVRLRHGWGLEASNLQSRVGRRLAGLARVSPGDSDGVVRQKLSATIKALAQGFPGTDRLAIEVAFGAGPGLQHEHLSQRIEILAERLNCAERTARRRIDRAVERLAEAAAAATDAPDDEADDPDKGWYVRRLEALLRLDTPTPTLLERRTIVANRDDLRRIATRLSLPRRADNATGDGTSDDHDVLVDVQHGARIVARDRQGEAHFRVVLDLPRTLTQGEEHTYTIVFTVPPGRRIRDHYAFVPLVACDRFQVRIRFDSTRPPRIAWRLDHLPPHALDDPPQPGPSLPLDDAGEVELAFDKLQQGFGYGISWIPAG